MNNPNELDLFPVLAVLPINWCMVRDIAATRSPSVILDNLDYRRGTCCPTHAVELADPYIWDDPWDDMYPEEFAYLVDWCVDMVDAYDEAVPYNEGELANRHPVVTLWDYDPGNPSHEDRAVVRYFKKHYKALVDTDTGGDRYASWDPVKAVSFRTFKGFMEDLIEVHNGNRIYETEMNEIEIELVNEARNSGKAPVGLYNGVIDWSSLDQTKKDLVFDTIATIEEDTVCVDMDLVFEAAERGLI